VRLTLLGTGAAGGVPLYGCQCNACQRAKENPVYRRRPSSALLEVGEKRYLLDAGLMDLDTQFPPQSLDGIFLTHFHPDHIQGLFHLRWGIGAKIPIYCPPDPEGCADLYRNPGLLDFRFMQPFTCQNVGTLNITPLPLIHSKLTFGYLFESLNSRIAYLVDTKDLTLGVKELLCATSIDLLILDACTPPNQSHTNHNSIDEALALVIKLRPEKSILTHIGHDLDCWLLQNQSVIPDAVHVGSDGAMVECV
jgi:phosphoribosyl 1,2-cyclic phosphate phosphodiesterase